MTKPSTKQVQEYTYENITHALTIAGWTSLTQASGITLWYPNSNMEYAGIGIPCNTKTIDKNAWELFQFYRRCITLGNEATRNVLSLMGTSYKQGSYEACAVHPNSNPQHYIIELTPRRTPCLFHYDKHGKKIRAEHADKRVLFNTNDINTILKYLITSTTTTGILKLPQLDESTLTVCQKAPLQFWFIAVKNGACTLYTQYQFISKADVFLSAYQASRMTFDIDKQYRSHAKGEWQGQVVYPTESEE